MKCTLMVPENPDALTIQSLIAVLKTGLDPSGIGSPLKKHDSKQRGPIIL